MLVPLDIYTVSLMLKIFVINLLNELKSVILSKPAPYRLLINNNTLIHEYLN